MVNRTVEANEIDFGNSQAMAFFMKTVADQSVLTFTVEHFNEDELEDAVVVYQNEEGHKRFVVVYSEDGTYKMSEERPAPVENQKIVNKNIDDEPPMEFIISGSKNGHYGYSIFRLDGGTVVDLFGEGMEDCCQPLNIKALRARYR